MLINNKLNFNLFLLLATTSLASFAQVANDDGEESVVTIIGNPVNPNNTNSSNQSPEYTQGYISTVNYQTQTNPPEKGKLNNEPKTIEPTLENGMHMRFEVESPTPSSDRLGSAGYASISGGSYSSSKSKKNTNSLSKRTFNLKKKFRCWFPKRKKKYRPNLCVDF